MVRRLPFALLVVLTGSAGCLFSAVERVEGTRAPRTATCGDPEEIRCLLPWPSNTFTRLDASTATGLRLAVEARALPLDDDPAPLWRADGFSRVSPLLFGIAGAPPSREALEAAVRVVEAPSGRIVRTHARLFTEGDETLVLLWPRRPLAAGTDHVVAVDDVVPSTRESLLALGRVGAASQAEAELIAYHAPTRAALARAGIDVSTLARVWELTTRSRADVTTRVLAMAEGARRAAPAAEVVIDDVELHDDARAATVEGRLLAMPLFAPPERAWTLDDDGAPVASETADVRFRVVLPRGQGDYPVSMYGHGVLGDFRDVAFDEGVAAEGFAKVAVTLHGWSNADLFDTFDGLARMFSGVDVSTARLAQGLADAVGVRRALFGPLGDALSAPLLGDVPNPAAGRRPSTTAPLVWTGGSLGGTLGGVYALVDDVDAAVLNVPGAGWTHIVPESGLFTLFADEYLVGYDSPLDRQHALAISQGLWDDVDPAVWADALEHDAPVCLLQESMGDRVLPNQGTELLAAALGATQVGEVLAPVPGLAKSPGPLENATGLTQFRVDGTGLLDAHGFAARDTPAGDAARAQIRTFLRATLDGAPRVAVPDGCAGGSCDFTR